MREQILDLGIRGLLSRLDLLLSAQGILLNQLLCRERARKVHLALIGRALELMSAAPHLRVDGHRVEHLLVLGDVTLRQAAALMVYGTLLRRHFRVERVEASTPWRLLVILEQKLGGGLVSRVGR